MGVKNENYVTTHEASYFKSGRGWRQFSVDPQSHAVQVEIGHWRYQQERAWVEEWERGDAPEDSGTSGSAPSSTGAEIVERRTPTAEGNLRYDTKNSGIQTSSFCFCVSAHLSFYRYWTHNLLDLFKQDLHSLTDSFCWGHDLSIWVRRANWHFVETAFGCVMSCHVMPCHVMSCHVMSCHVMSCHVMSCHVMSCHVMSCHVMSCHVMSCHDSDSDFISPTPTLIETRIPIRANPLLGWQSGSLDETAHRSRRMRPSEKTFWSW